MRPEAAVGEAAEVSSRAVPSREAKPSRSRCSPRDPGPQAAAQRGEECRAESLLAAGAPPGASNPPHPIGMRADFQVVWNVGPIGLRGSRAAGKAGPTQGGTRWGCGPSATPAPLPTWRPRPRGVNVYADGGGGAHE